LILITLSGATALIAVLSVRSAPPKFPVQVLAAVPSATSKVAVVPATETTCVRCTVQPVPEMTLTTLPGEVASKGCAALVAWVVVAPITKSVYAM